MNMEPRERGLVGFSQRIVWPLGALLLILELLRLSPLPLRGVFIVLFTAILVAAAVSPPARFLARYHVPRAITILLIYILAVAVLAGVIALIVPVVVSEVDNLRASLPTYFNEIQQLVNRVSPDQATKFSGQGALNQLSTRLSDVAGTLTDIVFSLVSGSISLVLILVMAFFMAVDENFAKSVITRFVPPEQQPQVQRIMGRIGTRMGQWARAQMLLALFFGVVFGIGLRIIGIDYAVTLGVIGGVLEIIPYVGGFTTVVLASLIALAQHPVLVIPVVIWYTVVVEIEGHVVAPKLMDRVLGIHPLVIIIALFLGGESLGILGALLAVPLAIVFDVLLAEFYSFDSSGPSVPPHADGVTEPDGAANESEPAPAGRRGSA